VRADAVIQLDDIKPTGSKNGRSRIAGTLDSVEPSSCARLLSEEARGFSGARKRRARRNAAWKSLNGYLKERRAAAWRKPNRRASIEPHWSGQRRQFVRLPALVAHRWQRRGHFPCRWKERPMRRQDRPCHARQLELFRPEIASRQLSRDIGHGPKLMRCNDDGPRRSHGAAGAVFSSLPHGTRRLCTSRGTELMIVQAFSPIST
jgi:hypothetical protein